MSRTTRRAFGRDSWQTPNRWTQQHPEQTCRPGCGVCNKAPTTMRRRKVRSRRAGRVEIAAQVVEA